MRESIDLGPDSDLPPNPASATRTETDEPGISPSIDLKGVSGNKGTHVVARTELGTISGANQTGTWGGGIGLAIPIGVDLPVTEGTKRANFEVAPGFPSVTEKILEELAPTLFEEVSTWPELRGVRATVRLYRFVSVDEKDLDLVRVELRVPGIGMEERYPLWRRFRKVVEGVIAEGANSQNSFLTRRTARVLREAVSTVLVG
jgi:hypothetical protein